MTGDDDRAQAIARRAWRKAGGDAGDFDDAYKARLGGYSGLGQFRRAGASGGDSGANGKGLSLSDDRHARRKKEPE